MGSNLRHHNFIRPIAWLLCLLLCAAALLPATAHALEGTTGTLTWRFTGGTLTITGRGEMPDYSDTVMPPWYDVAGQIARIRVEEGITSIGDLAFYGCSAAKSVSIPAAVTRIGDRAFKNCAALRYVALPAALREIGEATFESCETLDGIRLPEGLLTIGDYAFYRCTALTGVVIPASVTDFGMVVFAYCTGLTTAAILCPVEKVPDWTFYHCTALQSVALPATVTASGSLAFQDCGTLTQIYYTGSAAETLAQAVSADSGREGSRVSVIAEAYTGTVTARAEGEAAPDDVTGHLETVSVTTTQNATITQSKNTDFHYTQDGQEITLGEGTERIEQGNAEQVTTVVHTDTSVTATVDNSDGWTELAEIVRADIPAGDNQSGKVEVDVRITGTEVSGNDLGKLAGLDAMVEITTGTGDRWRLAAASIESEDVEGKTYDLGYSVTRTEEGATTIPSDKVYQVEFSGSTDFVSKVAINVTGSNAGQYATLYEKKGSKYTERETVLIDGNGDAWFTMREGVSSRTQYYVGVNVAGVSTESATVPHTMASAYGMDEDYTLRDAAGNYYKVGPRASRWGISGGRFALYVALALGAVILVVAAVMVGMNIVKRAKAVNAPADEAQESEEEMRIRIMREMLAEKEKKRKP
ncbi:MAG: leucine-rich repeat domain-containing protein [Oscillospiraceae bacterium]|nr:leucine-rich repeat domain-containing protein [Oscillospiraceae bacterium]